MRSARSSSGSEASGWLPIIAGDEGQEQRAAPPAIVVVVHQLGHEVVGVVRDQLAGAKIERAVQEVQQERVRIELVRRDHQFALGHGEQVGDAAGVQGASRRTSCDPCHRHRWLRPSTPAWSASPSGARRPCRPQPIGGHPTRATSGTPGSSGGGCRTSGSGARRCRCHFAVASADSAGCRYAARLPGCRLTGREPTFRTRRLLHDVVEVARASRRPRSNPTDRPWAAGRASRMIFTSRTCGAIAFGRRSCRASRLYRRGQRRSAPSCRRAAWCTRRTICPRRRAHRS